MEKMYDVLQQKFEGEEKVKVECIYVQENGVYVPWNLEIIVCVAKRIELSFSIAEKEKGYFVSLKRTNRLQNNYQDLKMHKEDILSYYEMIKECMEETLKNDPRWRIQYVVGKELIKESYVLKRLQREGE